MLPIVNEIVEKVVSELRAIRTELERSNAYNAEIKVILQRIDKRG
jgi:hypothetical protein